MSVNAAVEHIKDCCVLFLVWSWKLKTFIHLTLCEKTLIYQTVLWLWFYFNNQLIKKDQWFDLNLFNLTPTRDWEMKRGMIWNNTKSQYFKEDNEGMKYYINLYKLLFILRYIQKISWNIIYNYMYINLLHRRHITI